jgi:hypothetical protein
MCDPARRYRAIPCSHALGFERLRTPRPQDTLYLILSYLRILSYLIWDLAETGWLSFLHPPYPNRRRPAKMVEPARERQAARHNGPLYPSCSPQVRSPRPYAVQPQSHSAGVAHAVQPQSYGAASAAHSTVSGAVRHAAQLRQPARFTVHAFDEHGSRCTTGGAPFVLAVRGPSSASRTIVDAGDGSYHAAWVPTVTGAYTVAVSLHGELVGGAPFVVHANTPHADVSRSAVEGEGLHHAVAGEL